MGAELARTRTSGAEAVVVLMVVDHTAVVVVVVQEPEFAKKQAACMYC